jgi:hypothetical protein
MTEPAVQADDEVIACLLSERDYAIRSEELASGLFGTVDEVVELPDGFGYRFAGAESLLDSLLEFHHGGAPLLPVPQLRDRL